MTTELRGIVGKGRHGSLDGLDVGLRSVDQEVHILGGPDEAMEDDGETPNQDIACMFPVEGSAEIYEVFEAWRA
jgi:hypothetical protein